MPYFFGYFFLRYLATFTGEVPSTLISAAIPKTCLLLDAPPTRLL